MNRTDFKVGDEVRIISRGSTFYGQTGIITSINSTYATRVVFRVKINGYSGDGSATFYEDSLIPVGKIYEYSKLTEKFSSHDAEVIANSRIKTYTYETAIEKWKESKPSDFIVNVIFNDPATIVMWADGTKTVVKACEGEKFDPEKGLAMAIAKKALGNEGNYYETFKKWLPEEELVSEAENFDARR